MPPSGVPIVETALIVQALLHGTVDGGLSAVLGALDEIHNRPVQHPLPQWDLKHKVAAQFGPDDAGVQAVRRHATSCRRRKPEELLQRCARRFF